MRELQSKAGGGRKVASFLLVLALSLDVSTAFAEASNPAETVTNFIADLGSNREAARAMLARDAMFGIGDVGGPMDIGVFDQIFRDCSFEISAKPTSPMDMEGREIEIVTADMVCGPTRSRTETLFMVENGKIAGVYIRTDWPRASGVGGAE